MHPQPITPADTARAKLREPMAQFTRDECAALVGDHHRADGLPGSKQEMIRHLRAMTGSARA